MHNYSIIYVNNPKVDIFQLYITHQTYNVVLKTYWIRLIQRHWKNTYRKKMDLLRSCGYSMNHQYLFSINGKYPCSKLPGLKGMLSHYTLLNVSKYKN